MKIDLPSVQKRRPRRSYWLVAGLTTLLSALLCVVVAIAYRVEVRQAVVDWVVDRGFQKFDPDERARDKVLAGPGNWVRGLRERRPVLTIDVKFGNMEALRTHRARALNLGVLVQDSLSLVPATIRVGGRPVRVRIRLKGDKTDHFKDGRWAFRVEVRGDDQIMGMRRFSLHHPEGRDYHLEPVFLAALRFYGVLAPRYEFVRVVLNGERLGIMALEEHFSKELLESQNRRESVIVKFDESNFWASTARGAEGDPSDPANDYTKSEVVPFQSSRVARSPVLAAQRDLALGLYRGWLFGNLEAHEVFDPETTGRFIAVAHAFGAFHTVRFPNRRFYFNPVTARLEPIGFDAMPLSRYLRDAASEPFDRALLTDPVIRKAYRNALEGLAADWEENGLRAHLAEVEQDGLRKLRSQFPFLMPGILDAVPARADSALQMLTGDGDGFGGEEVQLPALPAPGYAGLELVKASTFVVDGVLNLELQNLTSAPVDLLAVSEVSAEPPPAGDSSRVLCPAPTLALPLRLPGSVRGAVPLRSVLPMGSGAADCAFGLAIQRVGDSRVLEVTSTPSVSPRLAHPFPDMQVADLLEGNPFLSYDAGLRELSVPAGEWTVSSTLVIPEGIKFVVNPGTLLRFADRASLMVRGGMEAMGTPARPITLTSVDDDTSWPGLVVFNAHLRTQWSHVSVQRTTGVALEDWALTAGVVFHRGRVELADVTFEGNSAEDALNLISTDFDLQRVSIRGALSDGLDVDFGKGMIRDSNFANIGSVGGGDAIDVSGATVTLENISFVQIGDKALSVGEGGVVRASGLDVDDAGAAIVSKDNSWVSATGVTVRNVWNTGLMAYTKKPEFGGAVLEATDVSFEDTNQAIQVQFGSLLTIDGQVMDRVAVNVDSLYSTVMKPGLRN